MIKLTEEEARELFIDGFTAIELYKRAKVRGYIKENPVEKAKNGLKEALNHFKNGSRYLSVDEKTFIIFKEAIEYLESKLNEKEKN